MSSLDNEGPTSEGTVPQDGFKDQLMTHVDKHKSRLTSISIEGGLSWLFFALLFFIAGLLIGFFGNVIVIICFLTFILFPVGLILWVVVVISLFVCGVMFWVCLIIGIIVLILACIKGSKKQDINVTDPDSTSTAGASSSAAGTTTDSTYASSGSYDTGPTEPGHADYDDSYV